MITHELFYYTIKLKEIGFEKVKEGVDVRIITPHVADKKIIFMLPAILNSVMALFSIFTGAYFKIGDGNHKPPFGLVIVFPKGNGKSISYQMNPVAMKGDQYDYHRKAVLYRGA